MPPRGIYSDAREEESWHQDPENGRTGPTEENVCEIDLKCTHTCVTSLFGSRVETVLSALGKLNCGKRTCLVFVLCATTVAAGLPAQTLTTVYSFTGKDGAHPQVALVQGADGDLYGTTVEGGANDTCARPVPGCGTVFKIAPSGSLTTLYSFGAQGGIYGKFPNGLVQATNGDFYGTAYDGGKGDNTVINRGTVFKITPSGTLTGLYSFCAQSGCTDGKSPTAGLVQATDGNFYGTTFFGGVGGHGTVFKITSSGALTTLYRFCPQGGICKDGFNPNAGLIQASNGDLYGTTVHGGDNGNYGTIFKITLGGTLTTLYSFCFSSMCSDGQYPNGLVQASNGDFYGTTSTADPLDSGSIFKITPSGALTTLYTFCPQYPCLDGRFPYAQLVQATDGDLYGTTATGGTSDSGTVFKITTNGALTSLYSFCSQSGCPDGSGPYGGLVQATNGNLYGTTIDGGGTSGFGTVFSLSVGLGPFVETLPASGKMGAVVKILGTNLTGATNVSFDGAAAVFEVVSSSEITATVPAGASSGLVQVVTPGTTLSSNVPFRVVP